jgi:hypothetical protein
LDTINPALRFILDYCRQRCSRKRIENGIERNNERIRAALRRPKHAERDGCVQMTVPMLYLEGIAV